MQQKGYSNRYIKKDKSGNPIYGWFPRNTSRKIAYNRYDKNQEDELLPRRTGMYSIIDFQHSQKRLHEIVCSMLNNLTKNKYIHEFREIYYSDKALKTDRKRGWISDDDYSGSVPYGIELTKIK